MKIAAQAHTAIVRCTREMTGARLLGDFVAGVVVIGRNFERLGGGMGIAVFSVV